MAEVKPLDYARNEVGVRMGSLHGGRHIGWTTDADKADRLRAAGAVVTTVAPMSSGGTTGYEVSFSPESTVQAREGTGSS